jgi:hypothetical protein
MATESTPLLGDRKSIRIVDKTGGTHELDAKAAISMSRVLEAQMERGESDLSQPLMDFKDAEDIVLYMRSMHEEPPTAPGTVSAEESVWIRRITPGRLSSLVFHASRLHINRLVRLLAIHTAWELENRQLDAQLELVTTRSARRDVWCMHLGWFSLVAAFALFVTAYAFLVFWYDGFYLEKFLVIHGVLALMASLCAIAAVLNNASSRNKIAAFCCTVVSLLFSLFILWTIMFAHTAWITTAMVTSISIVCAGWLLVFGALVVYMFHPRWWEASPLRRIDLGGIPSDFVAALLNIGH